MRIRKLIERAALCALVACIFMTMGIANFSSGGLINDPLANYTYSWNEFFTSTRPSNAGLTFGTPQVLSPTVLDFANNLQFSSISGGATPSDFVDGKLVMDITAKDGFGIGGLTLSERGTFAFGFGGTPAGTLAKVQLVGATLAVTAINGNPVTVPGVPATMIFQPNLPGSKTFAKTIDPDAGDWSGTLSIPNLAAASALNLQPGQRITAAKLIFDNQLATVAGTSTFSFIDKKDMQLSIIAPIPEPASIILLSMGALAFVFLRKRLVP